MVKKSESPKVTPSKEIAQDKDIEQLQDIIVGWKVFIWAMSIILILFGVSFSAQANANGRIDDVQVQYTEIRAQLAQIQADLSWLRDSAFNR